ncbi:MAG TPA: hypothetical protein VD834_13125 [Blastococcus sp.]|nr:hypothetical protein [Blastococcus sp.]
MTATRVTHATGLTDPRTRRSFPRGGVEKIASYLRQQVAERRHRQHLVEKRRHDGRNLTDQYIDRPDGTYRREILLGFVQR